MVSPLRVLAVCEDPPVEGEPTSAGHTLISQQVLDHLASDLDITLVYFGDREIDRHRFPLGLRAVHRLPLQRPSSAKVWQPRAVGARLSSQARDMVADLSSAAEVTYLHGLGTFGLLPSVRGPAVVNEIDPFSLYWDDLAVEATGKEKVTYAMRSMRLRHLERFAASRAAEYLVVNARDAEEATVLLSRQVTAVPNGVRPGLGTRETRYDRPTMVFVGSLDYAPNISSAQMLAQEVLPLVQRAVPEARVLLVGRHAGPEVTGLAGPGVDVFSDVPDSMVPMARAQVAVFPGGFGRGTRNSVLEALRAGTPTVASAASARGIPAGDHLTIAETAQEFADRVIPLLHESAETLRVREHTAQAGALLPEWPQVAKIYANIFQAAAIKVPE